MFSSVPLDLQWLTGADLSWSGVGINDEGINLSSPSSLESINSSASEAHEGPVDKADRAMVLAARCRKRYRERKKNEVSELLAMQADLETKLKALKKRNVLRKSQFQRLGSRKADRNRWEGVAFRQLQRRMEADALNRELRVYVQHCQRSANELLQAWQSHLTSLRARYLDDPDPAESKDVTTFSGRDMHVVASLLDEIEASYTQVEDVLGRLKLEPNAMDHYKSRQTWHQDSQQDSEYLELVEQWVVPFGLQEAVQATVNVTPLLLGEDSVPAILHLPSAQASSVVKFVDVFEDEDRNLSKYECIQVVKVYKEADRSLFRWRTVYDERSPAGSTGAQYHEHGWGIATPTPTLPSGTRFSFHTHFKQAQASPWLVHQDKKRFKRYAETMLQTSSEDVAD